jgi:hypothetical protein
MYYHCAGPIRKCPQTWALPYYMYYHCAGRIRKCPRPWALPYYMYYPCVGPVRGFGNALDLGPYPTRSTTILVQDPLEGLEMPSTLGLTYMYYPWVGLEMPLTLGPYPTSSTIFVQDPLERVWKCLRPWTLPYMYYYPCVGSEMPSTLGLTLLHVLSLCRTH